LDTSCIECVVWLGSACPWRALGGAECPAVRLCMGGRTGQEGGAIGSVVIYKERADKNEGSVGQSVRKKLELLHTSKLELSYLYLTNTVNIRIQFKRTSNFVCLVSWNSINLYSARKSNKT